MSGIWPDLALAALFTAGWFALMYVAGRGLGIARRSRGVRMAWEVATFAMVFPLLAALFASVGRTGIA